MFIVPLRHNLTERGFANTPQEEDKGEVLSHPLTIPRVELPLTDIQLKVEALITISVIREDTPEVDEPLKAI
jgi:hypothetical protein